MLDPSPSRVPFAPAVPDRLSIPISVEEHQQAAETGDTIVDVQAAQAAFLEEEKQQEEEAATRYKFDFESIINLIICLLIISK